MILTTHLLLITSIFLTLLLSYLFTCMHRLHTFSKAFPTIIEITFYKKWQTSHRDNTYQVYYLCNIEGKITEFWRRHFFAHFLQRGKTFFKSSQQFPRYLRKIQRLTRVISEVQPNTFEDCRKRTWDFRRLLNDIARSANILLIICWRLPKKIRYLDYTSFALMLKLVI